jgi:hypothetical protein
MQPKVTRAALNRPSSKLATVATAMPRETRVLVATPLIAPTPFQIDLDQQPIIKPAPTKSPRSARILERNAFGSSVGNRNAR